MPTNAASPSPTRYLTKLYIISLAAIAGLAIMGQILIQLLLSRQTTDLKIINTAHYRQTLSQRLLKTSLAVQLNPSPELKQQQLSEMQAIITEWKTSEQIMHKDLESVFSASDLAELRPVLERIDPASQEIVKTAKMILESQTEQENQLEALPLPGPRGLLPRNRNRLHEDTMNSPRLLEAERTYIQGIDQIISWYTHKVKQQVTRLQQIELGLLGLTLVVLVLEGILVFRPAVRKLQQTLVALSASLQETQATAKRLAAEQEKSERLLLNILPEPIANRLKREPQAIAEGFAEATILFADIVGFTELANRLPPTDLVARLNQIFSRFDALAEHYGLEKIKTIGDAYMVVGGLPKPQADHAVAIAEMALAMHQAIAEINQQTGESFNIRIGINTGPVVAGVIGIKKFIYDLWGDSVNIASRMESHGTPGRIQVTETTYRVLKDKYEFEERGIIHIKGRGEMKTYWLLQRAKALAKK